MWNPFSDTAKGAVEGFGTAIKDAVGAFKADPTKVAEFIAAVEMASMTLTASVINAVNATIQAESKSEHWLQWSWRPMFGYTAAAILINNHILMPYLAKFGIVPIPVSSEEWLMIMAVLGVAAWTRGRDKDAK
jgi:hypothetical protein